MNAHRRKKLTLILTVLIGFGLVSALVLYALRQNISLFYTPSQVQQGEAPKNQSIRLGGMVKKGSVHRESGSLKVNFIITDYGREVLVTYKGILPDLFREGQGIVTTGSIDNDGHFEAREVLAKHDENYMPPEVKAALKKQNLSRGYS